MAMQSTTQTDSGALRASLELAGNVLKCGPHAFVGSNSQTHVRIADAVAKQGAQRIGILAIVTAVTVVGVAVLQPGLQPEMAAAQESPLFRLSALFLVLAGIGLAALQRSELVSAQELLDLGLVFEVAGACTLAFMENAMPWPDTPIRGSTAVATWLAICVVIIPNKPWKSVTAAIVSAAVIPVAHLVTARILEYPALPWNRLVIHSLGPFLIAGWTPFISTRMHQLHEDLSRSQDFGNYHLEKLVGRGGMGEVWLARHRLLRRDAAVKLVSAGLLEHAGRSERRHLQRRFESEAQAIASLRSPHTVEIYDYGLAENGSLYYVMEYLQGLDAEVLVNRYGPQPAGRVVWLLRQVCDSLEEAHDAGLVHRDIKGSNVFVCRLGKSADFVKVLDFGLVKNLTGGSRTALTGDRTSGTPAFMSPEQVRGEDIDARADIYGLGCLSYFLLTGSVVFNKPDALAMAVSHLTEQPEPPSLHSELPVPQSLDRVVMACLEKSRENRPQSVAELRAMLDRCAGFAPWTASDAIRWWELHRPGPARKAS